MNNKLPVKRDVIKSRDPFVPARRYMLAQYVLLSCVCPSVCPCVCHKSENSTNTAKPTIKQTTLTNPIAHAFF